MNLLETLMKNIWFVRIMNSVIAIIINYSIYKIILSTIIKQMEQGKLRIFANKKTKTYVKLIKNIIRYFFLLVTALIILEIFGINISSLVAGVGIISIIVGFAIQDALKDIIKGFDILSDSYYQVGDVIKYKEITGKVLSIGLKTTKLEDIYSMNIISISNRNIEQVEVVSHLINIDIPLSYELKLEKAESVISEIIKKIKTNEKIEKCEYRGVNRFDSSSIAYQIKVYCNPLEKVQTRRDCLRVILETLEKNIIEIPYQQLDIHNK